MRIARALVLGATGGTGRQLTAELLRRGVAARVASRSSEGLAAAFGDTGAERVVADAGNADQVREALRGCHVVFHCVGLSMASFPRHVELAETVVEAAVSEGARPFLLSSYWSYGPLPDRPVTEEHPPTLELDAARIRRRQEDVFLEADGAVAVLPDFVGPRASVSVLNDALASLAAGRSVFWPGDPDAARDFLYLPDLGAVLCELAEHDRCWGSRWNVPGSGARTPRDLIAEAAGPAWSGRIRAVGPWLARIAGLLDAEIRGLSRLLPLYRSPVRLDGSALESLLGPPSRTPYEEALPATIRALEVEVR